jgi:hypothetical protein
MDKVDWPQRSPGARGFADYSSFWDASWSVNVTLPE